MKNAMISVIIATYNAEKYLDACLSRIEALEIPQLQVIIIDGGSTDNTLNIIKDHTASIHHWQSEPDQGIYDAMNKGIKLVHSGWVLFLGADDLLEDGFKYMIPELEDPNAIYYGMVDVDGIIYKGPYTNYRLSKLNICHQAIFYPAQVFTKGHQFNLKYPLWADWLLNIQCWKDPDFRFVYKPYLISTFGIYGASSKQTDTAFEKDRTKIIIKYFGILTWLRYSFRSLKKRIFIS